MPIDEVGYPAVKRSNETGVPIIWTHKSIPELAGLPEAKQKEIYRECWRMALRHRTGWIVAFATILSIVGVSLSLFVPPPFLPLLGLLILILGIVGGLVGKQFMYRAALPYIRQCVGGICPGCGYDVRATPAQCPECGRRLAHAL